MSEGRDLPALILALRACSDVLLVELLSAFAAEVHKRGCTDAARVLIHGARLFAHCVSGPDAPSDNGTGFPGDSGAGC